MHTEGSTLPADWHLVPWAPGHGPTPEQKAAEDAATLRHAERHRGRRLRPGEANRIAIFSGGVIVHDRGRRVAEFRDGSCVWHRRPELMRQDRCHRTRRACANGRRPRGRTPRRHRSTTAGRDDGGEPGEPDPALTTAQARAASRAFALAGWSAHPRTVRRAQAAWMLARAGAVTL
jgi:hypothetical protein